MTTATEDRIADLTTALKQRTDLMDGISSAVTVEKKAVTLDDGSKIDGISIDEAKAKSFRSAKREADAIMSEIKNLRGEGPNAEIKAFLEGKDGGSAAVAAFQRSGGQNFGQLLQGKTLGEKWTESEAWKSFQAKGFHGNSEGMKIEGINLGALAQAKDVFTSMVDTVTPLGFGSVQRDPMIDRRQRTSRVRDLFPVATTAANLIEFFRVSGFTNASAPVPERSGGAFGLKPQSDLEFEPDSAPVRTIAHYEVAHRNVLDDEPQLRSVIDNELLYGLRLTEDAQILSGDGTGENLRGILNTPGVQSYSAPVNTTRTDAIRQAITRSVLAYYDPTGLVIHPLDWEAVELQKDNQGAYIVTAAVAVGAVKQIWRLPVVDTPAIAQGTYLVGAFGLGATLYDRQSANIRIAEQHADFFIRNAVAILAEQRLALAVKRPESFVKMNIATS